MAAYKRLSWIWVDILQDNPLAPKDLTSWEPFMKSEYGVCAAFFESMTFTSTWEKMIRQPLLFETDHRAFLERVRTRYKTIADRCGSPSYKVFMEPLNESVEYSAEHSEQVAGLWAMLGFENTILPDPLGIPGVRQSAGFYFMTKSRVSGKAQYDRMLKQQDEVQ